MLSSSAEFKTVWRTPVVRLGMITVAIPTLLCFLPNIYLFLAHGVAPSVSEALSAWGMIAVIYGAFYIVEPLSYYPILGLSGTYISFVSGNISNMRIPCSAVAQDVAGTEPGTLEAEIVSTLGISGSVLTNMLFLTLAAIAGPTLLKIFPPGLQEAFRLYVTPTIFGAMLGQFAMKAPILLISALGIPFLLLFVAPLIGIPFLATPWIGIVASIFGTIGFGRFLYKKGKL